MDYVFKWRAEFWWALVYAGATYLLTLQVTDFENVTDWRKFGLSVSVGLVRAVLGALLALRSGGFRPEIPTGPAVPTIDERVGTSPRAVATPKLPDDQG